MSLESFSSNKPYLFRAIYQWILDNDATPHILVDADWPAVVVPQDYVQNGKIILNAAPEAISHWYSDNNAISFSARFSGKSMDIYLPIGAILAVYAQENNLGMAFEPEAKPQEDNKAPLESQADPASTDTTENSGDNAFSSLKSELDVDKAAVDKLDACKKSKSKKASHLKVIK